MKGDILPAGSCCFLLTEPTSTVATWIASGGVGETLPRKSLALRCELESRPCPHRSQIQYAAQIAKAVI